jgi:hypothetical protein
MRNAPEQEQNGKSTGQADMEFMQTATLLSYDQQEG